MIYEIHTTVDVMDTRNWIILCNRIGIKPLIIRLSRGDYKEQFMSSVRVAGDMGMAHYYAEWLERTLSSFAAKVIRTKIEIPLDQYDNWLRDEQEGGEALYLESHIRIDAAKKQVRTLEVCKERGLAISHSILKGNFWATQRQVPTYKVPVGKIIQGKMYPSGQHNTTLGVRSIEGDTVYIEPHLSYVFNKTYQILQESDVPVIDMHSEAVLLDTNPTLDNDWVNFDLQKGYVAA